MSEQINFDRTIDIPGDFSYRRTIIIVIISIQYRINLNNSINLYYYDIEKDPDIIDSLWKFFRT